MLSKKEVISDLNTICAQTKAHWLCYDDIHTVDLNVDVERYLKELKRIGYSTTDSLAVGYVDLAYGGAQAAPIREATPRSRTSILR